MPKVSVCVPTYNGARHLGAALTSILAQTFTDFELIVCDDASTDDTLRVASAFRDARLRVVANPNRLGLVGNWNRCLAMATGEYITLFHQDDVMAPENLAQKVAMLDANPGVGLVFSDIERIDQHGERIGGHYVEQPETTGVMPGHELFRLSAKVGNPIACPAVVARSACYGTLGCFDSNLAYAVDFEMWLRIAARFDIGYISRPLVEHRVHPGQETGRFLNTGRDYEDMLRTLDTVYQRAMPAKCSRHAATAYRTLSRQAWAMARWQAQHGRWTAAARYLGVAVRCRRRPIDEPSTKRMVEVRQ